MARGRMLNKRIATDMRIAKLGEECGPSGVLIYTWCIAHLDREGRMSGEPAIIKGSVFPLLNSITREDIETALGAARALGLVNWYDGGNGLCLNFPGFDKNQKINKARETPSEFPAPDKLQSNSGATPEQLRSNANELRSNVPLSISTSISLSTNQKNIPAELATPARDIPGSTESTPGSRTASIDFVVAHYQKFHPKARPGKKERALIAARIAEGSTAEDLCQAIDGCHASPFHQGQNDTGRKYDSLELICRNASKVATFIELAEQPRIPQVIQINRSPFARATAAAMEDARAKDRANDKGGVLEAHDEAPRMLPGPAF